MSDLTISTTPLTPATGSKDTRSRLASYTAWLAATGRPWTDPDLAAYRDALLARLAPASVAVHLATVRSRYREITGDRDLFWQMVRPYATDLANGHAAVEELIARIENAIEPGRAPVAVTEIQDYTADQRRWLTPAQVRDLLRQPDRSTLAGQRDLALLALILATGAREAETVAVTVADLHSSYQGLPALAIRHGKRDKQRLVPYGAQVWVLKVIQDYLDAAGIKDGYVFRNTRALDIDEPISTRTAQRIIKQYPILVAGQLVTVILHDLRRTYARAAFLAGVPVKAISRNMGHKHDRMTWEYIGDPRPEDRAAPDLYKEY